MNKNNKANILKLKNAYMYDKLEIIEEKIGSQLLWAE